MLPHPAGGVVLEFFWSRSALRLVRHSSLLHHHAGIPAVGPAWLSASPPALANLAGRWMMCWTAGRSVGLGAAACAGDGEAAACRLDLVAYITFYSKLFELNHLGSLSSSAQLDGAMRGALVCFGLMTAVSKSQAFRELNPQG